MKEIFKVGDRVYHYTYGWGEVTSHEEDKIITVKFSDDTITFIDGKLLSFTEYTLQGFTQERPIVLPEVGGLCLMKDYDSQTWKCVEFKGYDKTKTFPFVSVNNFSYQEMKRIKILD